MKCYYCGARLDGTDSCPNCEADVRIIKKLQSISNFLYNEGLKKVKVRDLSGAAETLKKSLRYDKGNTDARNLLGLIYYEMGEFVEAVSEWVISKSLDPEDNRASEYLNDVQNNHAHLEKLNQTIKKFNQALQYCKQGNDDLAVIQLKKVFSTNPKLVKGHQLMALLYMKAGKFDQAKRYLKNAGRVDANNTRTLLYLKECNEQLREARKKKGGKEETTVSYESGNDVIIRPAKFTDHTAVVSVVNILFGVAIGIAVVCFLVIPTIRQNAENKANTTLVASNKEMETKEQDISSLKAQIEDLNKQLESAKDDTSSATDKINSYEQMLNAYVFYADKKYDEASEALADVKKKQLSDDAAEIYDTVYDEVEQVMLEALYKEASTLYNANSLDEAIKKFKEIAKIDPTYKSGRVLHYIGYAYYKQNDGKNAITWFEKAAENSTSTRSIVKDCEGCIKEINENKVKFGLEKATDEE